MCKIFRTFAAEMKNKGYLYALYALFLLAACADKKPQQELTPWGTPVGEMEHADNSDGADGDEKKPASTSKGAFARRYSGQW